MLTPILRLFVFSPGGSIGAQVLEAVGLQKVLGNVRSEGVDHGHAGGGAVAVGS